MTIEIDTSKQIARIIRQHAALNTFPAGSQERISSTAVLGRFAQRDEIKIQRETFALVGFGLVKTTVLVEKSGFIARLTGPGEAIEMFESLKAVSEGLSPDSRPNRPTRHAVVTESATVVFVKTRSVLAELTNVTSRAAHAIALSCGSQEHHMLERLLSTIHGSAESRIAAMLLDLADRFGDVREDGSSFIPFHFTRAELASLCGCTQETMIRKLSAWSKTGLVTDAPVKGGGGIEIRSATELRKMTNVGLTSAMVVAS